MPNKDNYSELESAGMGALQGVSFGFSDEMGAASRSLAEVLNITHQGKSYEEIRDELRGQYSTAQEENPLSYGAGEIGAGIAAGIAVPGGGSARLMSALARGGVEGAAFGLGGSEAELGSTQSFKDTLTGGAVGIGGAGAGELLSRGVSAAGRKAFSGGGEVPQTRRLEEVLGEGDAAPEIVSQLDDIDVAMRDTVRGNQPVMDFDINDMDGLTRALENVEMDPDTAGIFPGNVSRPNEIELTDVISTRQDRDGVALVEEMLGSTIPPDDPLMNSAMKYGNILKSALERGGAGAAASTHHVLQQSDPEYQELMQDQRRD